MIVGDKKKHLAALLTLRFVSKSATSHFQEKNICRTVADPAGEPSDELAEMVNFMITQLMFTE